MPRIKIELANIYCKDTEDFVGADEVYLLHSLRVADAGLAELESPVPRSAFNNITEAVDINDGEVKRLPVVGSKDYNILFDRNVRQNQVVTGSLYLVDRDLGELAEGTGLLEELGGLVLAPLALIALLLAFLVGGFLRVIEIFVSISFLPEVIRDFTSIPGILVVVLALLFPLILSFSLALIVLKQIGKLDGDDLLGGFVLTVEPEGPDIEVRGFDLRGSTGIDIEGGTRFSGTWGTVDYTVNISIVRFA